jgi:hypothetical protein
MPPLGGGILFSEQRDAKVGSAKLVADCRIGANYRDSTL